MLRKVTVTVCGVILLLVLVLSYTDLQPAGEAKARSTRTFASFTNSTPITFTTGGANLGSPYPSSINVQGMPGVIPFNDPNAIKVTINNISHTWLADLAIVLKSPKAESMLLQLCASDNKGFEAQSLTYSISDAGATRLSDVENPIQGGVYRPASFCNRPAIPSVASYGVPSPGGDATISSILGGSEPNGSWNLYVVDFFSGDGGVMAGGWTLDLITEVPTPTTPGWEGDVVDAKGSPIGDGLILANDVVTVRQFVLGNAAPIIFPNQFQRADVNEPCGNGRMDAGDVTVIRQIILGTLQNVPACGPTSDTARPDQSRSLDW